MGGIIVAATYDALMSTKVRLSASVDADLVAAAEKAVVRGRFESLSAWVNEALRLKLDQELRLEALSAFVSAYERQQGVITAQEMASAVRHAQARAIHTGQGPRAKRRRASHR